MNDIIFQQAPFDDENDIKRINKIAEEIKQRLEKIPSLRYGECNKCGYHGKGLAIALNREFICVKCITKKEIERKFKKKNEKDTNNNI